MIRKLIGVCAGLAMLVVAGTANGSIVTNGDFEAGDTGFTSDFTFVTDLQPSAPTYTIVTDPALAHGSALSYGDHTTGSGLMLAANGGLPGGGATTVWQQTVSVDANTPHEFSFYLSSWFFAPFAAIEVLINDVSQGSVTAPSIRGIWEQSVFNWSSGAETSASLKLVNTTEAFNGNDFAIDDIALVVDPIPTALPLMGTGLALLGFLGWWRRRQAA